MKLEEHPTVKRLGPAAFERAGVLRTAHERGRAAPMCVRLRRADAGLVEIARPGLAPQRDEILRNYPWTKTLLSFVVRMAREPVRGAPRSVANLEFHRAGHEVDSIAAQIVARLEARGIRAVNPSMGFPMEMYHTPSNAPWVVSHKPIAVEAGLGHMGIHRNLIHPRFGNFVLLGTVLLDAETDAHDHPIDYNPLPRMQALRRRLPGRSHWPGRYFQFRVLLHPQLSRVLRRLLRLDRANRRRA